ncbi:MAG: retroviral-like aspartic protease family protein [Candidatus Cloacimonadota bacterium]|nr:retroviral-like aspartic protease family protein [Candidatus Cloacimonadota bacterium]
MGLIYAELELANPEDLAFLRKGYIKEEDIKKEKVTALVDSGAYFMCINEHIQAQLDLPIVRYSEVELANGNIEKLPIAGPLTVNFANRGTSCDAIVLPGKSEVLLGAIPMEALDVVLNPKKQTIEVNPESPYLSMTKVK